MVEQEINTATGFLDPIFNMMASWPVPFQVVGMLALFGVVYKIIDVKYLQPRIQKGANGFQEIEETVASLESHLTNHLTTDVGLVVEELKKVNETLIDIKTEVTLQGDKIKRHGDIQISTSRTLNEHNRVMVIVADRARIERPQHKRLPESDDEPFNLDG